MSEKKIILLHNGNLLLAKGACGLPAADAFSCDLENSFEAGEGIIACECTNEALLAQMQAVGVREACDMLPDKEYAAVVKAAELLHWNSTIRYCSHCGQLLHRNGPISKVCESCGAEYFPKLSPCIIVLVRKGQEALLVHARTFKRPFFGLVAGFVETGETLEQCVAREVMEETSLKVKNIRYWGSQSWPFPSQLMIGFTADYAGGELRFADGELTEGGFFSRDNLPQIPSPPSIARRMIQAWLNE